MNIKEKIQGLIRQSTDLELGDFLIEKPKNRFGDYATNAAFGLAKTLGRAPAELATELAEKLNALGAPEFSKIESAGGYVNFFLASQYLQQEFVKMVNADEFGQGNSLAGQTIMVEYTDPNPFKLFHIGHLMTNTIGEAIARLYEANGAKVIRANYQGDVGLHVAKAIYGMQSLAEKMPTSAATILEKNDFLGEAYVFGAAAYEENPDQHTAIETINNQIYSRSDEKINQLYDLGRQWSLDYFETIYVRLGTKFDHYFFESEVGQTGLELVKTHPEIFSVSAGATIFAGENYGLHTRVFVNSQGLPTYEAKELGLNKTKFELYPLDLSVIVTGNEINEYFRVLLKALELVAPAVATKTRHVGHGMLRLPEGKMSSRTGQVITAVALIDQIKDRITEVESENSSLDAAERAANAEPIALGAIKYSILKQSPGRDIIFDFDKSLAVSGDSGPYLQYAFARLRNILAKADSGDHKAGTERLDRPEELDLVKQLIEFPEAVEISAQQLAPQNLAGYLFHLANLANSFYEQVPVLKEKDAAVQASRLALVELVSRVLKSGLNILGIQTLEKI